MRWQRQEAQQLNLKLQEQQAVASRLSTEQAWVRQQQAKVEATRKDLQREREAMRVKTLAS